MLDQIPESIGRYRILDVLGQGGMGRVYRAQDESLGRTVALKVLLPVPGAPADFAKRFLREARAAASINHPNVITCYDVGDADGTLYMALELVTGGDAARLMAHRGGRLSEREALLVVRGAAAGLLAIEQAGLLHRDIKPANIFLTDAGEAKLADLGLVRSHLDQDQLTQVGAPMGTPAYMSPEQARGEADLDIRSDIFSLGCSLYAMLSGASPFLADSPVATLSRVLSDEMPDITQAGPDLSPETCRLLAGTLAKDRSRRIAGAGALVSQAQSALTELRGAQRARTTTARRANDQTPATGHAARQATPAPDTDRRRAVGTRSSSRRRETTRSQADLRALAKRVHVAPDGLRAWINLAPQVSFPRVLLDKVLDTAGVCHGLQHAALLQATRGVNSVRRLVIALGDPPLPDQEGTDVCGQRIPPVQNDVVIVVAADYMEAHAIFRPGTLCDQMQVKLALLQAGVRYGIDRTGLLRLWEGPPDQSGRRGIARGTAMIPGEPAGFRLAANVSEQSLGAETVEHMSQVRQGQMLARWSEEVRGRAGMDVHGREIIPPRLASPDISRMVGEGCRVERNRDGVQMLVAERAGYVQQQVDGRIRVISAVEVPGDCGPDSPAIDTDDVVLVRGNVLPGARINSSNDVVIMGDLQDAAIEAGGSLQVQGNIGAGDQAVLAGDGVAVGGDVARRVVTGSLRVDGAVENCEIVATGDIEVHRVVGGSLIAGGNITVQYAGDDRGATTEMWAGHLPESDDRAEVIRVNERRIHTEYRQAMERLHSADAEVYQKRKRMELIERSDYRSEHFARERKEKLDHADAQRRQHEAEADEVRQRLAAQRQALADLRRRGENAEAVIEARVIAYRGVVACIGDAEPLALRMDRAPFKMRLQ
ncbi:MAG: protein kinase domain-containing protein [Planctomycetota bacterium]